MSASRQSLRASLLSTNRLLGKRFVPLPVLSCAQIVRPELALRGQIIVGSAVQGHIRDGVLTTPPKRVHMMKLQMMRHRASRSGIIDVRAAHAISLIHRAPDRGRYSTPARAWRALVPRVVET